MSFAISTQQRAEAQFVPCRSRWRVAIAFGSNLHGQFGTSAQALQSTITQLRSHGVEIMVISPTYLTKAVGQGLQLNYLNAVFLADSDLTPRELLRLFKRLELRAGRKNGIRNGPRPLDLDLLAVQGQVIGWRGRVRRRGDLIVPHPEMAKRAFVLVPFADVAPFWVHPVLNQTPRQMLAHLAPWRRSVQQKVD